MADSGLEPKGHNKEARFKQFDVVTSYSDHHFNNYNKSKHCFTSTRSKAYKKIMQEWKVLEKNLPESIFVRVYEGRIDLLRAVIIGAAGTPYHDGLFFFDLAFPPQYPDVPPKMYFHSYGLRLNPNLYENAYVCLSLLNTWTGLTNEKWNPDSSTVLQVLVSMQGLVLNEKPFYNEPGTKTSPGWYSYNEKVFLLSLKAMQFVIKNPPKNFESFVVCHFRESANRILRACQAYGNGRFMVGFYRDDVPSFSSVNVEVSSGLKVALDSHYSSLSAAFTQIEMKKKKQEIDKRDKHGIRYKIIGKLKKIFGIN